MLGFCSLATAALGTDGGVYVQKAVPGVAATGTVGTLFGDAASVQLAGVAGMGAIAPLPVSPSLFAGATATTGAVGFVVVMPELAIAPILAGGCVAAVALDALDQATGVAGNGVAAQLADYLLTGFAGVTGQASVAPITPDVGAALGAYPVTSDGVLGLWTLGDAVPGIDAPPENLLVGVVGNGTCSPLAAFPDSSVSTIGVAASVAANPGGSITGVISSSLTGQFALTSIVDLPGVAAIGSGSAATARSYVSVRQIIVQGCAGFVAGDLAAWVTGVSCLSAFGIGNVDDPSASIAGRAATAAPGVFLSHSPSSAFALWGAPVPGGSVTVAFTGLPSIAVTVGTGQTAAQVASSLAALINANMALVIAGLSARTANNLVELHQPQPAVIAPAVTFYGT